MDDGVVRRVNKTTLQTLMIQENEIIDLHLGLFIHQNDYSLFLSKYEECISRNISYHDLECRVKVGNSFELFHMSLSCIDYELNKTVLCYLSTTVSSLDQEELKDEFYEIIDHVNSSILKVNENGIIVYIMIK